MLLFFLKKKNILPLLDYLNNKLNEMISKSPADNKTKQKILSKALNIESDNMQTPKGQKKTNNPDKLNFSLIKK